LLLGITGLRHRMNDVRADRRGAADKGGEQRVVGEDDLGAGVLKRKPLYILAVAL
jgi:hypothetical protein